MNKDYRGDTFFRSYSINIDGELYQFQSGDKIKVAFCLFGVDKKLLKEIKLIEGNTEVDVTWSAEEMSTLNVGDYVLEVEFETVDFTKTYQENIKISEDFIYGEQE